MARDSSTPLPRHHGCVGNLLLIGVLLAAVIVGGYVYSPPTRRMIQNLWPGGSGSTPVATPFPPNAPLLTSPAPLPSGEPAVSHAKPFVNTLGMEFVPVPWENATRLFSRWETRVQDYEAYAKAASGVDATWRNPGFDQGPTHPVVRVDWQDARNFCTWLTGAERRAGRLGPAWEYRLPTDLEWSAAAGLVPLTDSWVNGPMPDPLLWPWGHQWPPPRDAGNYDTARDPKKWGWTNPYLGRTAPVGSYVPNGYGLYDLGGNANEWVNDESPLANEPRYRVMRGGHWEQYKPTPSAYRDLCPINFRKNTYGFRVVIAPAQNGGR